MTNVSRWIGVSLAVGLAVSQFSEFGLDNPRVSERVRARNFADASD